MAVISPVEAPQATWDLGMAGVARRAAWLPGENAKPRSATARSVSMCTPPFRSWSDPPFLSFPRPPSVPVEYRGPNAWHVESRCSIATTTRYSLTLQPENQRSFCPRSLELTEDSIRVLPYEGSLKPVDVITLPHPGYPTDLQAQLGALMTQTDGISIITERIYPNRFMHVPELQRMGAGIAMEGASAIIKGPSKLSGAPVMASDLRASAALILAAFAAAFSTFFSNLLSKRNLELLS